MSKGESTFLLVSNGLVVATGLVYGWMAYLVSSEDPDALVNHPLQPDAQHAHVLVAPLLVFALGLVWRSHVWPRMRSGQRAQRESGLPLVVLFVPMASSGYLLQTAAGPAWRTLWAWVHLATSLAWALAFAAHWAGAWRSRRRPTA